MSIQTIRHGRPHTVTRVAPILALAVVVALAPSAGWGVDLGESPKNWFRVSWQPVALPSTIEGRVSNTSPFRAIDVRLHIEGVDAANHRLGERLIWAGDDIAPGGTTAYFAQAIAGAVDYRVSVVSFKLVSERGVVEAE